MKKFGIVIFLTILFALMLAGGAQAIEIFLWDHDNNLAVADPVFRQNLNATDAIRRTLDQLELDYTFSAAASLPNNLEDYDVVIIALAYFCDS